MTAEIGHFALCLALALSLVMSVAGLLAANPANDRARSVAISSGFGLLVFVGLAFAALTVAFVTSDFSVAVVAQNSHTAKPMLYKIAGVWGNHEGSMLLWVLVLALYSAAIALRASKPDYAHLSAAALGVQGIISAAFLLFILLTSNPFLRLDPPPFEGAGLNPLLQDPGLSFHPPTLYFGYVGFSATFAYAAAALITGEARSWTRLARPFMLVAWIALTIGITAGSRWAYYVLGWGGFWFWDPVENASLMPWLAGTALLHSALATERTGAFTVWSLLLAIATFSLSLIGTFLVRSGVLSSVHAFASDPSRGLFILLLIVGAVGGALALFAWRAPKMAGGASFATASRDSALLFNNVLLVASVATVFVGTLYPLALDAVTGTRISVGPPFFAMTIGPIFVLLMILVPFGTRLSWRRGDLKDALRTLSPAALAAAVAAVLVLIVAHPRSAVGAGSFALATWVIGASIIELYRRARAQTLSVTALAAALAHAGLGVSLIGVASTTLWKSESLQLLAPGESTPLAGYRLRFDGVTTTEGPNYEATRATVEVLRNGNHVVTLYPEKRVYPAEGQDKVETAIHTTPLHDIYVALGDQREAGRWTIRAYVNPFAQLIWAGGGLMAAGGIAAFVARWRRRRAADPVTVAAQ